MLLQLASTQPRCLTLGDGDRVLRLHAHISPDARWNQQLDGATGKLTLEAVIGGRRAPIEILVDDGLELSGSWSDYKPDSSLLTGDGKADSMQDVILEISFSAWEDVPDTPLPSGLMRLNVWSSRQGVDADGGSSLETQQLPDVLLSSETIILVPKIWAAAVPEVAQAVQDLEADAQPIRPTDASPAPHVALLSDLAMVIEAALDNWNAKSPFTGGQGRLPRWARKAATAVEPPQPALPPLRRAYLEEVLLSAEDLATWFGTSGHHCTAQMLEGCSRLLELKLGREMGDCSAGISRGPEAGSAVALGVDIGDSKIGRGGSLQLNAEAPPISTDVPSAGTDNMIPAASPVSDKGETGGLGLSTSPPPLSADCMGERAGAPESDPERPFGVSVAWAIAMVVAGWISAMYQILWLRVSE